MQQATVYLYNVLSHCAGCPIGRKNASRDTGQVPGSPATFLECWVPVAMQLMRLPAKASTASPPPSLSLCRAHIEYCYIDVHTFFGVALTQSIPAGLDS